MTESKGWNRGPSLFVRYLLECLKRNGYTLKLAAKNTDCWYVALNEARLGILRFDTKRKSFSLQPYLPYTQESFCVVLFYCLVEQITWEYKPSRAKSILGIAPVKDLSKPKTQNMEYRDGCQ